MSIKVTIWNEYRHEKKEEKISAIYPQGIHNAIADGIKAMIDGAFEVRTATLDEPYHGLTDEVLEDTDVLIWWGHMAHHEVDDEIVKKVHDRVIKGMGLIVLHSGHHSKIFRSMMGTTCNLRWREADERERVWVIEPSHPIAADLGDYFELPQEEMYGERFDIPVPDELVFMGWFKGGEVFRSGCCFNRGYGKIFYFQPGHESYPTFYDENVLKIISNAIFWAKKTKVLSEVSCIHIKEPLEVI